MQAQATARVPIEYDCNYQHILVLWPTRPRPQLFKSRYRKWDYSQRQQCLVPPNDLEVWCPKCNEVWLHSILLPLTDFWSGPDRTNSKCPLCGPGRLNLPYRAEFVHSLPRELHIQDLYAAARAPHNYFYGYN